MKETPIELARRMLSVTLHGGSPVLSHSQWQTITEALEARPEQQPFGYVSEKCANAQGMIKSATWELFRKPTSFGTLEFNVPLYIAPPAPAPVTVKLPDTGLTEFERGVFYAAYLVCELHDDPTIAADVIKEASLDGFDISGLDDCERESLLKLNASEKLSLTAAGIKIAEGE